MTYESNCTLPNELLAQIANEGLGCLPELIRTIINTAMQRSNDNNISAWGPMNARLSGKRMPMVTNPSR